MNINVITRFNGTIEVIVVAIDRANLTSEPMAINISIRHSLKPPIIYIKTDIQNQTLTGIVKISGWIELFEDNLDTVQIQIDNGQIENLTAELNWSYTLDTKNYRDGYHTLKVTAKDNLNQSTELRIPFYVDNRSEVMRKTLIGIGLFFVVVLGIEIAWSLRKRKT